MASIEVQGAEISVIEAGAGEPVVLLHSSACSALQWRTLIDALKQRHHVVAPDLFGYGASEPWTGAHRLQLADEAEIVSALVERCGGPVHLVGHSYGGAVALRAALSRPGDFRSLTLIEPVCFYLLWNSDPLNVEAYGEIRALADSVWAATTNGDYRGAMTRFVEYWNGEGAWERLGAAQQRGVLRAAPKVALDFWATLTEPKVLSDYAALSLPTLMLSGAASPLPTRRIAAMLARALAGAGPTEVEGAGHMLPLTHRRTVNEAVAAHVEARSGLRHQAA